MGITIAELNAKYNAEDKAWDFKLFPMWLKKHGIPDSADAPIVKMTLEQVLIVFSKDNIPEKHHDFDRKVLAMAQENKKQLEQAMVHVLESSRDKALKEYDSSWYAKTKVQKIIDVIRGRD